MKRLGGWFFFLYFGSQFWAPNFFTHNFTVEGTLLLAKEKTFVIKYASIVPKGTFWYNAMNKMRFRVHQKSQGRLKIKMFYGGIAGDERTIIRKMRNGNIQMAVLTGIGLGMVVPEIRLLEVPGFLRTNRQVDNIIRRSENFWKKKFLKKGFIFAGMSEGGWVYLMTKKKVTTIQQLKGMKLWMPSSDKLVKTFMKELGIVPVPLGIESVLTQLQTGGLDAIYAPPLAAVGYQWFRHIHFVLDMKITNLRAASLIDKKFFKKLPRALQKLLLQETRKTNLSIIPQIRQANQKALQAILKSQVKLVSPQKGELKKIYKTGGRVIQRLTGKMFSKKVVQKLSHMR